MGWEFHFRNLTSTEQWFGVYHAGCAEAPWHTARPRCWQTNIWYNPTGGGDSVYPPSALVGDFGTILKDVSMTVDEMFVDFAILVGTEGTSLGSLISIMVEVYNLEEEIIQTVISSSNSEPEAVIAAAQQGFANACQQINQPQETVTQYAEKLGLGSSGWGFIAGPSYQKYIFKDNVSNDGFGWTVLRSDSGARSVEMIANAAFVQSGHLIYMYDSENWRGFWNPF